MNYSLESKAREHIQSLRPNAMKHGLGPAVVDCYMREHLPKKYKNLPKKEWLRCRDYKDIREEAEGYRPHFIPDLCEFYEKDREIIIYEIEDKYQVSKEKEQFIREWIFEMDCWDAWDVLIIITNRFGRGWDILIDTQSELRKEWLNNFRDDPQRFIKLRPQLHTESKIIEATAWRNWPFNHVTPRS